MFMCDLREPFAWGAVTAKKRQYRDYLSFLQDLLTCGPREQNLDRLLSKYDIAPTTNFKQQLTDIWKNATQQLEQAIKDDMPLFQYDFPIDASINPYLLLFYPDFKKHLNIVEERLQEVGNSKLLKSPVTQTQKNPYFIKLKVTPVIPKRDQVYRLTKRVMTEEQPPAKRNKKETERKQHKARTITNENEAEAKPNQFPMSIPLNWFNKTENKLLIDSPIFLPPEEPQKKEEETEGETADHEDTKKENKVTKDTAKRLYPMTEGTCTDFTGDVNREFLVQEHNIEIVFKSRCIDTHHTAYLMEYILTREFGFEADIARKLLTRYNQTVPAFSSILERMLSSLWIVRHLPSSPSFPFSLLQNFSLTLIPKFEKRHVNLIRTKEGEIYVEARLDNLILTSPLELNNKTLQKELQKELQKRLKNVVNIPFTMQMKIHFDKEKGEFYIDDDSLSLITPEEQVKSIIEYCIRHSWPTEITKETVVDKRIGFLYTLIEMALYSKIHHILTKQPDRLLEALFKNIPSPSGTTSSPQNTLEILKKTMAAQQKKYAKHLDILWFQIQTVQQNKAEYKKECLEALEKDYIARRTGAETPTVLTLNEQVERLKEFALLSQQLKRMTGQNFANVQNSLEKKAAKKITQRKKEFKKEQKRKVQKRKVQKKTPGKQPRPRRQSEIPLSTFFLNPPPTRRRSVSVKGKDLFRPTPENKDKTSTFQRLTQSWKIPKLTIRSSPKKKTNPGSQVTHFAPDPEKKVNPSKTGSNPNTPHNSPTGKGENNSTQPSTNRAKND